MKNALRYLKLFSLSVAGLGIIMNFKIPKVGYSTGAL